MSIFDRYQGRYETTREEEMSVQDYLELCRKDRSAYASVAERILMAIGEPELVDTHHVDRLSRIFANKVILGVDGVSLKHGCTVPTIIDAEVVRKMIDQTKGQVIVVADHSKWGAVSNFPVANIDEIDKLVTDEGFSKSAVEDLKEQSIETLIASNANVTA
jgi:predicted Ser/Thr protein kinase